MWVASWLLWSVSPDTIRWMHQHYSGQPFPAMLPTFLRKRVFTPSSNKRCAFSQEKPNYKNSPSPFGIKMVDRVSGKPLHLDISDLPMKKGIITNRNKFVLGPSGSGKSFFMNHPCTPILRAGDARGTHRHRKFLSRTL